MRAGACCCVRVSARSDVTGGLKDETLAGHATRSSSKDWFPADQLPILHKKSQENMSSRKELTELGYGNNAVEMETTATYNKADDTFTIHSPSVLSQK